MRILFIGDIFGRPGRTIVRERLPGLVAAKKIDLVIANAENAAAGFGITPSIVEELLGLGPPLPPLRRSHAEAHHAA